MKVIYRDLDKIIEIWNIKLHGVGDQLAFSNESWYEVHLEVNHNPPDGERNITEVFPEYGEVTDEIYKKLEEETVKWSQKILERSPLAIRMLKGALNADCDGQAGLQQFAGDATMLFYMTEEAQEGRDAFKEKRKPNFKKFPKRP